MHPTQVGQILPEINLEGQSFTPLCLGLLDSRQYHQRYPAKRIRRHFYQCEGSHRWMPKTYRSHGCEPPERSPLLPATSVSTSSRLLPRAEVRHLSGSISDVSDIEQLKITSSQELGNYISGGVEKTFMGGLAERLTALVSYQETWLYSLQHMRWILLAAHQVVFEEDATAFRKES